MTSDLSGLTYDVAIIGAGVVGANIARELSRYNLRLVWLEKENDVSCGCSKANSGIVHGGFAERPGTVRARLCLEGNRMFAGLENQLHFGYQPIGSLVLAFADEEVNRLEQLLGQGQANGVEGLEIIKGERLRELEPRVNRQAVAALYCPQSGVVSPYEMTIALAENAVRNGVRLLLGTEVLSISRGADGFTVVCQNLTLTCRYLINAAGLYSDRVAELAGDRTVRISPRRGQYVVLSKPASPLTHSVIFQCPSPLGKGVLVAPTCHGNVLLGPNAEDITEKDDVGTDEAGLRAVIRAALRSVPAAGNLQAITSFAGNRPYSGLPDWLIGFSERVPGLINLLGIDSPGLTASPAIARLVADMLQQDGLTLEAKGSFCEQRPPIIKKKDRSFRGDVNATDPQRRLICRCEQVTAAEVIDAVRRPLPVTSTDAIKRRTRAGMGPCQGAFCRPRVVELLSRITGLRPEQITTRGKDSPPLPARLAGSQLKKLIDDETTG
ncbi:MAG: NAD(P)/FAD-dependent oxidoreductase [Negativicutes bacterium]|nr:NAD(P)/FAD-dependent oxidoreductase [Negativicutes bacterium]